MQVQAEDLKGKSDAIRGLEKDVSWRGDRVRLLEREVAALKVQLEQYE